jgi:uncharacterized membrane protein required for colicin V production
MMLRKLILTTAAAAFLAAPLAAQAAPVRASTPVDETESLSQGVGLLLGASFVLVLILLLGGDDDSPTSP